MLVRSPRIGYGGLDLNIFDFDYDLTWTAFFLNADGTVYGRYGGRDPKSADSRFSLAGLRFAMNAALQAHRQPGRANGESPTKPPLLAEQIPSIVQLKTDSCIHCHQINTARRQNLTKAGRWSNDMFWVYPLPENVGLTLDNEQGNRVRSVATNSPGGRAGIRPGDILQELNGYSVASFGDAQHALHKGPDEGSIPIVWHRAGETMNANLDVVMGWRRTDWKWRPSMRNLPPALKSALK